MEMKVYNLKQYFKIIYETNKFYKILNTLNEGFDKEIKKNALDPEKVIDVHLNLVGGEVKELDFE